MVAVPFSVHDPLDRRPSWELLLRSVEVREDLVAARRFSSHIRRQADETTTGAKAGAHRLCPRSLPFDVVRALVCPCPLSDLVALFAPVIPLPVEVLVGALGRTAGHSAPAAFDRLVLQVYPTLM